MTKNYLVTDQFVMGQQSLETWLELQLEAGWELVTVVTSGSASPTNPWGQKYFWVFRRVRQAP